MKFLVILTMLLSTGICLTTICMNEPSKSSETKKSEKEELSCAICKDNIALNENRKALPCAHLFHEDCIDSWLKLKSNCPVCRRNINGDEDVDMDDDEVVEEIVDNHVVPLPLAVELFNVMNPIANVNPAPSNIPWNEKEDPLDKLISGVTNPEEMLRLGWRSIM